MLERTSQLRGLGPLREVEKLIISRADAAEYLVSTIEPEDEEEILLQQEVYRLVGLIPDDADLLELQVRLLRVLVLGFYDTSEDALFIVEDIGITSPLGISTVVHELVHALQDQHYDIEATYESLGRDWDAVSAYTHLIEGDARMHELQYVGATAPASCSAVIPAAMLRGIPAVIQRELESPYTNGLCFARTVAARLAGGIDAVYANLPRSMEQVLHPHKYLEGEEPIEVTLLSLAGALGSEWSEVASRTFGEFWWWNYLLLGLRDNQRVMDAAAGWGGDRWHLYRDGSGRRLIHIEVAWDTQADAFEFWSAFLDSLTARRGTPTLAAGQTTVSWQESGRHLRATIRGDRVTLVISDDPSAAERAAAALGLG